MSVRAYKIKKFVYNETNTFNIWTDEKIARWLENNTNFFGRLGEESNGITGIEVGEIKSLIEEVPNMDKGTKEQFEDDIKGKEDCDWVDYICF